MDGMDVMGCDGWGQKEKETTSHTKKQAITRGNQSNRMRRIS
jgi:hypothetical protein